MLEPQEMEERGAQVRGRSLRLHREGSGVNGEGMREPRWREGLDVPGCVWRRVQGGEGGMVTEGEKGGPWGCSFGIGLWGDRRLSHGLGTRRQPPVSIECGAGNLCALIVVPFTEQGRLRASEGMNRAGQERLCASWR